MTDEEKLKKIKINNNSAYCNKDDVDFLLNLIENQQKEIEKLTAESTEWESKVYELQDEINVLNAQKDSLNWQLEVAKDRLKANAEMGDKLNQALVELQKKDKIINDMAEEIIIDYEGE